MSLYNNVVAQIKKHQAESEADFSKFIDTSKKLIKGLDVPEKENEKLWNKMKQEVDSLKSIKPGDEDYGDLLADDSAYQQQMENVSLDFSADERNKRLQTYSEDQQKRLAASDAYIDQHSEKSE